MPPKRIKEDVPGENSKRSGRRLQLAKGKQTYPSKNPTRTRLHYRNTAGTSRVQKIFHGLRLQTSENAAWRGVMEDLGKGFQTLNKSFEDFLQNLPAMHQGRSGNVGNRGSEILSSSDTDTSTMPHNTVLSSTQLDQPNLENRTPCEINHTSRTLPSSISLLPTPEKPKFNGRNINPIRFLEALERFFRRARITNEDRLDVAVDSLTDGALNWADVQRENWKTYEDFRKGIIKHYWSIEEQSKLRNMISSDKWNLSRGSMTDYVNTYISEARLLTPPIPDSVLTAELIGHFPLTIRQLWMSSDKETLNELVEFLRRQSLCYTPGSSYTSTIQGKDHTPLNHQTTDLNNKSKNQGIQRDFKQMPQRPPLKGNQNKKGWWSTTQQTGNDKQKH